MPTIFISYRRDDTQVIVGRISDWLDRHYGQEAIFVDIDSVPLGLDFRERIRGAIQRSDIVLAVIGPDWLAIQKETGKPRIADEMDWVRIELETALAKTIPVIPVLVEHARLPKPDELPEALRDLSFRAATVLDTGADFRLHMERLIRAMDQFLGVGATRSEPERGRTKEKVPEGTSRETAYDDFLDIIQKFKTLSVGALGIGTAVPFFAYVAGIAPPWPPGIMLVTALTELVCLIVVFQFLRSKGRKLVNRVIAALALSLCLASLAYFILIAFFTYVTPHTNERFVKGFVCRPEIQKAYGDQCPLVSRDLLSGLQYTAENVWMDWSVALMQVAIAILWLVCFIFLSSVIGSFLVFQTKIGSVKVTTPKDKQKR
jgi:TIR domain